MARLYRPHIPVDVRCRVALRQLGEMWPETVIDAYRGRYGTLLAELLQRLAELMHPGESIRFHLDHDPPLGARQQDVIGQNMRLVYIPDANDPAHLIYREAVAHGIKTRVRGEHGQFSDLALIKRERRRAKKVKKNPSKWRKPKTRWANRPFPKRKKL